MTGRTSAWELEKSLSPGALLYLTGPRRTGRSLWVENRLKERKLAPENHLFDLSRSETRRRFRESIDWLGDLRRAGSERPLLVFDEAHRMPNWNWTLKTVYDQFRADFDFAILANGAGAAAKAREIGMFPRTFLPFTPGEIERLPPLESLDLERLLASWSVPEELLAQWEKLGGFPEPFLGGSEARARKWWEDARARVLEEDLRDQTRLESADLMGEILEALPSRVGRPLSLASIRDDVGTSFPTVKRYVSALEDLYFTFSLSPYSEGISRAVTLEKKAYFYHPPAIVDPDAAFENRVALVLARWVLDQREKGRDFELRYLRDQDRREVDFVIVRNGRPHFLFEAAREKRAIANSLRHYSEKLGIPGAQIVRAENANSSATAGLATLSLHTLTGALG